MDVIWRLGTELRHFDQEIWGGNNCDMVVFTVDERRLEVFFSPFLSVSIVHFTVNSLWQSLHLPLRCKLSSIQSNLNSEKKKKSFNWFIVLAWLRLNFIDKDSSFHVQKFHTILFEYYSETSQWRPPRASPKLADLSISRGVQFVMADYSAWAAKVEWDLALPLSLP